MAGFDQDTLDAAAQEREVDLTTWGRKTGKPVRITLWIWGDGRRLFVRSGGGLSRDWPRNLLAKGRGILHLDGKDIPIRPRHVTDPLEARACSAMVVQKYGTGVQRSSGEEPLTPGEQASFELLPDEQ